MTGFQRYAVYYAPRDGAFAQAVARWLGRDAATGQKMIDPDPHDLPDLPDLPCLPRAQSVLTAAPRIYGFHGTLRAPFRLAQGVQRGDVEAVVAHLAARLAPVRCKGLTVERIDRFLALTPLGCEAELLALGASVVEATEPLRAPLTPAEIARRRPDRLSPRQRTLLQDWGYPFVMEEFRFHLTLTDALVDADEVRVVTDVLRTRLGPVLPEPFLVQDLCLFGEDGTGLFHLLSRWPLTG